MADTTQATTGCDLRSVREAVCIHTDKITDSCLAKDCIEELHVYLTVESQQLLDTATSAKARYVELLKAAVEVESVPYSVGYYTVDTTYYYRVLADASLNGNRPAPITGLAVFAKRQVLFGGDTTARIFSSEGSPVSCHPALQSGSSPEAVVEVVDPIILASTVQDMSACRCPTESIDLPREILDCFDTDLVLNGEAKRLLVTIGQFSITRLQRPTQLLIPSFDYCIPTKTCPSIGSTDAESPCQVFSQIDFPMDSFFPGKNDTCIAKADSCTNCCTTK